MFLKYRSVDLIILYYCIYFRLLSTTVIVVQNFIELMRTIEFGLMRNAKFSSQVDWNKVWSVPEENEKSTDVG